MARRHRRDDPRTTGERRDDALADAALYRDQIHHGKWSWMDDRVSDNIWLMLIVGGFLVLAMLAVAGCAGAALLLGL